ncbi:MAG: hypothetical protein C0522_01150 [Rhodocyclaceae bacterium]|jgi:hypothetical protein|nr:hypothetical protein [Rhodocyclaceae bacterium]
MKIADAVTATKSLRKAITESTPEMAFCFELCTHHKPLHACFRDQLPAPDALRKSGVYFITDAHEEILYVGKATSENLGAEIWGKFGTPTIIDPTSDTPRFEKSSLAESSNDIAVKESLVSGDVLIFALAIEPAALCSLVEVFLQTLCKVGTDQCLPKLNKQIG